METSNSNRGHLEILARESYDWAVVERAWTGRPEFAWYFPEKVDEDSGEVTANAAYYTQVSVVGPDGKETWIGINLYGEVAEAANENLKQLGRTAQISCEGRLKTVDARGIELKTPSINVKCDPDNLLFQVHQVRAARPRSFGNPFAGIDAPAHTPPPEPRPQPSPEAEEMPF